jgi:DNA recombination protein RmuC
MEIIVCISAVAIIASILVLYFNKKQETLKTLHQAQVAAMQSHHDNAMLNLEKENATLTERNNTLFTQIQLFEKKMSHLQFELEETKNQNTLYFAENRMLNEKTKEQLSEFQRLQKQASLEFENIANKILKKNTEDFVEVNHLKLNDLLSPLKERISVFEKKVEETYEKGLKDQTDLKAELKKLYDLNHRISNEANNLTRALKGDVKQQGNWGEMVLERIL